MDQMKLKQHIEKFYDWFGEATCADTPPTSKDFEKFFASNATLTLNGKLFARNVEELAKRFSESFKDASFKLEKPFKSLIATDDTVVVHWCVLRQQKGAPDTKLVATSIFTFNSDGLVKAADEVFAPIAD